MTNPVALLRTVEHGDIKYDALMLWCPGCVTKFHATGLHMLPISDTQGKRPQWTWNGSLELPGVEPSILTKMTWGDEGTPKEFVCHSFLRNGIWDFLTDCTHEMAGQKVPMVPLPDWMVDE